MRKRYIIYSLLLFVVGSTVYGGPDDPVESEKRPFHVVSHNQYPDTDEDGYDDYEEYDNPTE